MGVSVLHSWLRAANAVSLHLELLGQCSPHPLPQAGGGEVTGAGVDAGAMCTGVLRAGRCTEAVVASPRWMHAWLYGRYSRSLVKWIEWDCCWGWLLDNHTQVMGALISCEHAWWQNVNTTCSGKIVHRQYVLNVLVFVFCFVHILTDPFISMFVVSTQHFSQSFGNTGLAFKFISAPACAWACSRHWIRLSASDPNAFSPSILLPRSDGLTWPQMEGFTLKVS